jgi:hypothetical protein
VAQGPLEGFRGWTIAPLREWPDSQVSDMLYDRVVAVLQPLGQVAVHPFSSVGLVVESERSENGGFRVGSARSRDEAKVAKGLVAIFV